VEVNVGKKNIYLIFPFTPIIKWGETFSPPEPFRLDWLESFELRGIIVRAIQSTLPLPAGRLPWKREGAFKIPNSRITISSLTGVFNGKNTFQLTN